MSTATEKLTADERAIGVAINEATNYAETLAEECREKYETAGSHGWGGVAGNMQLAVDRIEAAIGELQSAEYATSAGGDALAEINDQMSSPEVAERITIAIDATDTAKTNTEGAIGLVDETTNSCLAAGLEEIPGSLNSLREMVMELFAQFGEIGSNLAAEFSNATNYSGGKSAEAKPEKPEGRPGSISERGPDRPGPVAVPKNTSSE
jgi:hypothetical protein